ncbi:Rieske (2Fe-2S) protein [Ilumatobacter coccineus]|uniref:Rieske domain-containing protein n=1 Tax=Ilumatobacter coccineus (strain NBRC 103263 / KCTC 29153 / YM16-304) TaxID=1313172 RepID=A0A6C7E667_ILUCY|nr:Rieske 2Fe-2S domain-containing protein [Ilumatobacter coccineus]BAN00769.1 hypothetical protein YM304_04550 [Ilumatobacter coccineus YM16-304]
MTATPNAATPNITATDAEPEAEARQAPVADLADLADGSMKMLKVDGHRVCLVRTSSGVHALDHACPHEGYGLTQGNLDGDVLTCAWHNWKFKVTDGTCVLGEEAVRVHDVDVDPNGEIRVTLNRPDPQSLRPQLMASLRRGTEKHYVGQIARDTVRLLKAGAEPAEIMWDAAEHGLPRAEYGWDHALASATDCLAMVDLYDGDERALPLVQGVAGIAETARDRRVRELPDPTNDASVVHHEGFRAAVEREDLDAAQAIVRAAVARGDGPADLVDWFSGAVSDHHLSYGHGAIYSQKAFELLEMVGWEHADAVLGHLTPAIVYGTREDTLPYMKPFMRALAELDLDALAAEAANAATPDWTDDGTLRSALLGSDRTAPVAAAVRAVRDGAGIDGLLDAVVDAVSERMLRYDFDGEFDFGDDFGWLDITHGLTYPNAVRWLAAHDDGRRAGDLLRLAMFTAFQAHWTGRHEWHTSVGEPEQVEPLAADVVAYGDELQRRAHLDGTTAFIVHAHAVKTSRAAALEARRRDTTLPLDATARFLASPKLERFVAANVVRSIDFLNGRTQRD